MKDSRIEITIAFEVDEDWAVADLFYEKEHWASATLLDGELVVRVYGQSEGCRPIPLDSAIETLRRASDQLRAVLGANVGPPAT